MKRVVFPTGRANKRLSFLEEQSVDDGRGGREERWVEVFKAYGTLEPLSDRERVASEQVQQQATHKSRIRYRQGVHARLRVQHGERVFHVTGVTDEEEQHVTLILNLREVTP